MHESNALLIRNARLLTPVEELPSAEIEVRDGRVYTIERRRDDGPFDGTVVDAAGMLVTPGLVDVHVHGSAGYDTMDATPEALEQMARFFAAHGVTSFLATTMTAPHGGIARAIANAVGFAPRDGARMLGVHLEGPYLSPKFPGAQSPLHIRPAKASEYEELFSFDNIRLMTIAPEVDGNRELVLFALARGTRVSIGHSDASYEDALAAIELGVDHVTHTFNAMRGLHHRHPGLIGAALTRPELFVELIADGVHVHPAVAGLLLRASGAERAVLISDAMRATGLADGVYDLGGQPVTVGDGIARLADGTLAGSTLTLDRAVRNVVAWTGLPLSDVLAMATRTPARSIGLEREVGELRSGGSADLVLWDDQMNVCMTLVQGRVVYKREES